MKRPKLTKDRLRQRDAIIDELQASELDRLAGEKKLAEHARQVINERAVVARERVQSRRKVGEADDGNRIR